MLRDHFFPSAIRTLRIAALAVALLLVAAATAWLLTRPVPAYGPNDRLQAGPGDAARGRLVFAAADCGSCHASPGQTDRSVLGGGLEIASPYGTMNAPNISPHPVDGIGRWRAEDLGNALLAGVSPARRHYYPVFPYASYARMKVQDVADLMAYLQTLPAVAGRPPRHDLTFPFNIRRLIGFWKLIYLDRSPLVDDPGHTPQWNRGRYLVDAVSHCAECHSSRNVLGGIKSSTRFAGGRDPTGTGFVPNITPTGIGHWSEADVARLLADGRTPDLRTVGSSMASVVENAALLAEADRRAIAAYVVTLRPRPTAEP